METINKESLKNLILSLRKSLDDADTYLDSSDGISNLCSNDLQLAHSLALVAASVYYVEILMKGLSNNI